MANGYKPLENIKIKENQKVKKPGMYKVVMHNDDYTTMDFVVEVLMKIFHKDFNEANDIMLNIHFNGKGVCGIYTYDIARTKANQVHQMARMREFPLRCTVEKV